MKKYLMILFLISPLSAFGYDGEELLGVWVSLKSEAMMEFEHNIDTDYWDKNIMKGYAKYFTLGVSYAYTGTFQLKNNRLTINYTQAKNTHETIKMDETKTYIVRLGFLNSGLRYIELTNVKNKAEVIGPLYLRNREISGE